jgi:serine/threonine-protein kinase
MMNPVLQSGERIGDWVVDAPLGEGGMGAVYRVHSALVERLTAALKVLKPTEETDGRARFVREAEALSALSHPAIVRVMGFGEDAAHGLLYLAMELVEGETLAARLERGPLSLPDALSVFVPLASALEHAHQAGIFHRDIKPSNIVLCRAGFVRLVDFGIALQLHGGETITTTHRGTLSYLPPELFRGQTPDPGCMDVYALGLVLHEALTGARPFRVEGGITPAAVAGVIAARKLESAPFDPGPAFPDALRDIVRAATQSDPRARPSSSQLHAALRAIGGAGASTPSVIAAAPSAAAPEPTVVVPDAPRRAPRALYAVLGAMVPVLVAVGLLFGRGRGDVSRGAGRTRPVESLTPATAAPAVAPAGRPGEGGEENLPYRANADATRVDGLWEVANAIEDSSHPAYRGLRLGYEITLRQHGRRISGEGHKVSENGAPLAGPRRTPILVTGMRRGRDVSLTFMERGAERNTAGTLEWRLSADGTSVSGSFASDAAGSRGSSTARRVGAPGGVPRRED